MLVVESQLVPPLALTLQWVSKSPDGLQQFLLNDRHRGQKNSSLLQHGLLFLGTTPTLPSSSRFVLSPRRALLRSASNEGGAQPRDRGSILNTQEDSQERVVRWFCCVSSLLLTSYLFFRKKTARSPARRQKKKKSGRAHLLPFLLPLSSSLSLLPS